MHANGCLPSTISSNSQGITVWILAD